MSRRNDLCGACGRWHDHTGLAVVAMIDSHGKRWPIAPGTMPRHNGDDAGGREYGDCGLRLFDARVRADQTELIVKRLRGASWRPDGTPRTDGDEFADLIAREFGGIDKGDP